MELPNFADNFWAGVGIAAAVATALATGVSTFLSALWRWRDRPEAEWALNAQNLGGFTDGGDPDSKPELTVELTNVGDGDAYKVTVSGYQLKPDFPIGRRDPKRPWARVTQPVPVLRTGDSISVTVEAESPNAWNSASFTVSWWHAPTRRRRKWIGLRSAQLHLRFYLRDLGGDPSQSSDTSAG